MLDAHGRPVQAPADDPAVLQTAACCALCNDSSLSYNAGVCAVGLQLGMSAPLQPAQADLSSATCAECSM